MTQRLAEMVAQRHGWQLVWGSANGSNVMCRISSKGPLHPTQGRRLYIRVRPDGRMQKA